MTLIHNGKMNPPLRLVPPRPPLRRSAVAEPAQIIRAVAVGIIFAVVFLWALPQGRMMFAGTETALKTLV